MTIVGHLYLLACYVAGLAFACFAPETWLSAIGLITAIGAYITWLLETR